MLICVTDLDGTLLDAAYAFAAAREALRALRERGIPLVFCTSKTRAEVEFLRAQMDNVHPFIVENGGALYIPDDAFPLCIHAPVRRDGYAVIEFGSPYADIVRTLQAAAEDSGCTVRGFCQMSAEDISARLKLPLPMARLAKQREYDEPFEILDGDPDRLMRAIEDRKRRWTRGGRFYHILGANDKGHCVLILRHLYERMHASVIAVGFGDALNDAGFLKLVDIAYLMESESLPELQKAVPGGRVCAQGPGGWNAAMLDVLGRYAGPHVPECAASDLPTRRSERGIF